MPKIVGTRERVHQPFYDSLIRVDGSINLRSAPQNGFGALRARTQLFSRQAADMSITNLATPGQFTSDQTFVCLAIRVWTYFRVNFEALNAVGERALSPDAMTDRVARVHKMYHQSQNQLFFDFTAGDKPQIQHFTAYTPFAGGLDGFFAGGVGGAGGAGGGGGGGDPYLASAADFVVLAGSTVTNVPALGTIIHGNLGISPGAAVTGFGVGEGVITGVQEITNPVAVQAKADLTAAMIALNGQGPGTVLGGVLDGLTLTPGVYSAAAGISLGVGQTVILDGAGEYVFLAGSTVILGNGSTVSLINGADAANIYWVANSSATIGTTADASGNFLADQTITLQTGATLVGRTLASVAAVNFDNNDVSLSPNDPVLAAGSSTGLFPRANNGVPTSGALMRLARPILIPPRQGFRVFATISPLGEAVGSSLIEQLNGLLDDTPGLFPAAGVSANGADNIEKDIKYLIDGIHSRDVL